ncbi:MAG: hypothetical protein AB8B59_02860 [Maribacter sp.]
MLKTKSLFFKILLVLTFSTSFALIAQDDFQDGYVVTNKNDTLFGKVRDRDTKGFNLGIYEKIRFKRKSRKKRFAPKDIIAYKIGNKHYKSFFLGREMVFFRVGSEGRLNHYILEVQEQGESLVQDIDYVQMGKNGSFVRANQGLFGIKKKRLADLLDDCVGLPERILNKEFRYVFQIVDFYNNCQENQ